jgi:Malectin domain
MHHSFTRSFLLFSLTSTLLPAQSDPKLLYLYGNVQSNGTMPAATGNEYHQMRLNDEGDLGLSEFATVIEAAGLIAEEKYDVNFTLTEEALAPYKVIILGSNQKVFSSLEKSAVKTWVENGGGLIAWSDANFGGSSRLDEYTFGARGRVSNNSLTDQFGMYFYLDNRRAKVAVFQDYEMTHFINNYSKTNSIQFGGEGVSTISVTSPAETLVRFSGARTSTGSLDTTLVTLADEAAGWTEAQREAHKNQDRKYVAALAIAQIGKGRVVGAFDRNAFWNYGSRTKPVSNNTNIDQYDHRNYAYRILTWAAGLEPKPVIKAQINVGGSVVDSFSADGNFTGGKTYSTTQIVSTASVANAAPQPVYSSERYALSSAGGAFTYGFTGLANQTVTVRLHFAEIFKNGSAQRVFDVAVNGTKKIDNLDIFAVTGGKNRALVKDITIEVGAAGTVSVEFISEVGNAKVSAIEILSHNPNG